MSWNCRGLNSEVVKKMVRDSGSQEKASLICIQETKCTCWPASGMKLFGNNINESCIAQSSEGASGGLGTCWNLDLFQCMGSAQSKHWIWVQMKTTESNIWFNVINVYSPLTLTEKRVLWKELLQIMKIIKDELVCLVGDFNSIRDVMERVNCCYRRNDMQGFNNFIKDANLLDLDMINDSFTCFGPQGKCTKLDRFLENEVWLESGQWSVKALCRLSSDHKPILLSCKLIS